MPSRHIPILSDDEIAEGARRIGDRSHQPFEDLALYYFLFATGAHPLEIVRLEVRDYLDGRGGVRRKSQVRPDVAINGRSRPLFFCSTKLDEALGSYLSERLLRKFDTADDDAYRGLHPASRLFVSSNGQGFQITAYAEDGERKFRCRGIVETYRKIFRYAELKHTDALSARQAVVSKLYARGADYTQVGLLLGIAEPSSVHARFPIVSLQLEELVVNLV